MSSRIQLLKKPDGRHFSTALAYKLQTRISLRNLKNRQQLGPGKLRRVLHLREYLLRNLRKPACIICQLFVERLLVRGRNDRLRLRAAGSRNHCDFRRRWLLRVWPDRTASVRRISFARLVALTAYRREWKSWNGAWIWTYDFYDGWSLGPRQ